MPPVLILPGWKDSGPDHWQSRWVSEHGDIRVSQHDYLRPRRGDWMARLDEVILDQVKPTGQPALIAAHSLGCHLTAAWAAHSQHTEWVCGALLVAPPDTAQMDWPADLAGWRSFPSLRLPFASCVVASTNDTFASMHAQAELARVWGSTLRNVGPAGHINAESGLGGWREGREWLQGLAEPDVHCSIRSLPNQFRSVPL